MFNVLPVTLGGGSFCSRVNGEVNGKVNGQVNGKVNGQINGFVVLAARSTLCPVS